MCGGGGGDVGLSYVILYRAPCAIAQSKSVCECRLVRIMDRERFGTIPYMVTWLSHRTCMTQCNTGNIIIVLFLYTTYLCI